MFSNLKAEMARNNIPAYKLAKKLNIHRNTLQSKMNGTRDFTLKEIEIILGLFPNKGYDYFFKKN